VLSVAHATLGHRPLTLLHVWSPPPEVLADAFSAKALLEDLRRPSSSASYSTAHRRSPTKVRSTRQSRARGAGACGAQPRRSPDSSAGSQMRSCITRSGLSSLFPPPRAIPRIGTSITRAPPVRHEQLFRHRWPVVATPAVDASRPVTWSTRHPLEGEVRAGTSRLPQRSSSSADAWLLLSEQLGRSHGSPRPSGRLDRRGTPGLIGRRALATSSAAGHAQCPIRCRRAAA